MPCLAFLFHNFGQLIHSKHLTDLVDDSKQQQSVKNSDNDWSIVCALLPTHKCLISAFFSNGPWKVYLNHYKEYQNSSYKIL